MLKNPLPFILLFVVSITLFSCGEKASDEIYSGKLEELIVGTIVLEKDNDTKYIYDLRTVPGEEDWVILPISLPGNKGTVLKFYNLNSGKKFQEILIPTEGPESLKGGMGAFNLVLNSNEILVVGRANEVGLYDSLGNLFQNWDIHLDVPSARDEYVQLEGRKGLLFKDGDWVQIGQNPSNLFKNLNPKTSETRSEFPLDFKNWLVQMNLKTKEVRHSDFEIPGGYGSFQHDMTSTYLMGAFDSDRKEYFLGWPYSDSIYKLSSLKLLEKFKPRGSDLFKYFPSEEKRNGRFMSWDLPKESSAHIFLLYDPINNLFVRASKINESGEGETKFERTKHYVLSFYSSDWEAIGEYFFDFGGALDLENWFLTGGRLFINKPEQPNEDQYEFYKIDLSKVKK